MYVYKHSNTWRTPATTRTRPGGPGPRLLRRMRAQLEVRSRLLPGHVPLPGPGPFKFAAANMAAARHGCQCAAAAVARARGPPIVMEPLSLPVRATHWQAKDHAARVYSSHCHRDGVRHTRIQVDSCCPCGFTESSPPGRISAS